LNPALDVSQYAHTAWRFREGFTRGEINDIAQTPDGYLWLGTSFGLYRFDGVRIVLWEPPGGQHLPSEQIRRLLASRDGTLWIGTRNGLAGWKDRTLTQVSELDGLFISRLVEDHAGSIWVGARQPGGGKLCEMRNSKVRCSAEAGAVMGLHEDGKGTLWAGSLTGVWRWQPGPREFFPVPSERNGIQDMGHGEDGTLLIPMTGGVRRIAEGELHMAYPFPPALRGFSALRMLRDRDGGLWVGTADGGIVHIHQGRTDIFSQIDGLTADFISSFFEDREGDVWVATRGGLDRFRELPVATYTTRQGLSGAPTGAVLATKDGSIWFGTRNGLNRLIDGKFTVYRERGDQRKEDLGEVAVRGLPDGSVASLFQDTRGRIWVSSNAGVGYLENDRLVSVAVPGRNVAAFAEDGAGNLWIAHQEEGLFRVSPDNEVQQITWDTVGPNGPAWRLASDPRNGGVWLGFGLGGILYFRGGQAGSAYSAREGLGAGSIGDLRFDGNKALWAATAGGLSRLKDGRVDTLTSKNGLPCDAVQSMIEDDAQSVWLLTTCGLVRVARSELDVWIAARDKSSATIHPLVFDNGDGVQSRGTLGGYTPIVAKSPDGKLWFVTGDGIGVVDPRHLTRNPVPPPVQIERIVADDQPYDLRPGMRLPANVRTLRIEYTALSLVAPEKNHFKYKLEGQNRNWHEVINERQATYTNLSPRNYRFRVMAANNDGVWNEAGASLNFSVAPAYYQTTWFLSLCIGVGLGMLFAAYQLRLRYLRHQFNIQMEARVGERTRIARDLHDTLLQSFQGVLLKFSSIQYMMRSRPDEAEEELARTIEQARAAITEGREAVHGLRSSTVVANDLARTIGTVGESLGADQTGPLRPEFRVEVEGNSRDLPPLVRDEVYRIACEALRNAFQHAHARRIEVEIRYDPRQFRLRIADDGRGIDETVLSAGGRAGHHGLPGMSERAKLAGGKLSVWSRPGSGTEIELTVPASIAYSKQGVGRPMSAEKDKG
jgi:signal transduction histidine kinase/ligand-binding sensor domain-containing protein